MVQVLLPITSVYICTLANNHSANINQVVFLERTLLYDHQDKKRKAGMAIC